MSGSMKVIEPTVEECADFASIGDVLSWARIAGSPFDTESKAGALLVVLGGDASVSIGEVASIDPEEFTAALDAWTIGVAALDRGRARTFHKACRIAGQVDWSTADTDAWQWQQYAANKARTEALATATVPVIVPPPPVVLPAARKIKVNEVADITRSDEIPVLDARAIDTAWKLYATLMHSEPPAEAEPTADQLSVLHSLLHEGGSCYVDLSIWGPHGVRIQKAMKLTGLVLTANGDLIQHECKGPPDFGHWSSCFRVFMSAMIMLGACSPPHLIAYADLIAHYAKRYGQSCWGLIYQMETRFRREQLERMKRRESRNLDAAVAAGGSTGFDPARPFDYLFSIARSEREFWHLHVEEPCLLIVTRARSTGLFLDGDAPVCDSSGAHLATFGSPGFAFVADASGGNSSSRGAGAASSNKPQQQHAQQPPARQSKASSSGTPRGGAGAGVGSKVHNVTNGRFTTNRYGNPICVNFQSDSCKSKGGINCPVDGSRRHVCNRCLSSGHGAESGNCQLVPTPLKSTGSSHKRKA
jgi:hypothetical protein